jgi:pyruvate-formate lyase
MAGPRLRSGLRRPSPVARAYALAALLTGPSKHIYEHDRIAGSLRGLMREPDAIDPAELAHARKVVTSYGTNHFLTNKDHFAPDYQTILREGIEGILSRIQASREKHRTDPDFSGKSEFLEAAAISMNAFSEMIRQYGRAAARKAAEAGVQAARKASLNEMAASCMHVCRKAPRTFQEALQLVWLVHQAFLWEGRFAMALGRLDQYLDPFFQADLAAGRLTREEALDLLQCTLLKIAEFRLCFGNDDVVNIAIAGRLRDGSGGVNDMSWLVLEAVENCQIPGPNLSARLYRDIPDPFIDRCLQVIGSGLGYPALMNDEINIPALQRHGYDLEDCRDYAMVGCIENFLPGLQPPWSDGRFNVPKYLELALNSGRCMLSGQQLGPDSGDAERFSSMQQVMTAFEQQLRAGASEYMMFFRNENDRYNRKASAQPFLSCFCRDCVARGLDINDGGAVYPSAHGAGCMGIATVADSLAAIEEVVFTRKEFSMAELHRALLADFAGCTGIQAALLAAPKYGNNLDQADQYACWYVDVLEDIFSGYRTPDGGPVYTAIASNVQNVSAGREVAATPDGRHSGRPLSDAASPMAGADRRGPTAVVQSLTKPDYTKVSCGTVLNQKFSPGDVQ